MRHASLNTFVGFDRGHQMRPNERRNQARSSASTARCRALLLGSPRRSPLAPPVATDGRTERRRLGGSCSHSAFPVTTAVFD